MTRQLRLYWQSFKVFTKNHSCIELWAIYTLAEEKSDQDPSFTAQMEKMQISRNVSTGFPHNFTGGRFTLKMYFSRVTQSPVNVTLETEICPRCYVLMEQALFKNWRAKRIENFLPPSYSFLFSPEVWKAILLTLSFQILKHSKRKRSVPHFLVALSNKVNFEGIFQPTRGESYICAVPPSVHFRM